MSRLRGSLRREPWYRQQEAAETTDVIHAVNREIRKAADALAERMPLNDALELAIKTAEEIGAGYRGWEKVAPVKSALANLVNPTPTCPNCGAGLVCGLCGCGRKE